VIVIGHAPTTSIDRLSRILRLSHAGTVRLVDRLVERNPVEKRPSALDRTIMRLALTTDSWQQRDKLLAFRRAVLTVLLNQAAPEDLAALEHVAETIAAARPEDALSALKTCRFCDERRCIDCPMEVFGSLKRFRCTLSTIILTSFQEVEDDLTAQAVLNTEAEQQCRAIAAAEQALAPLMRRYKDGADTYLQEVISQTVALQNERNQIEIRRHQIAASVLLIKALGGG
jgi:MarR family transcriptional regulator, negative regulator of the multidrug operon emrRAB